MKNIEKCECCIGIINDYDNTSMVTLDGLKNHIKDRLELKQAFERDVLFKDYNHGIKGGLWLIIATSGTNQLIIYLDK